MDKKSNILLFGGSVGLIIAAIVLTALIDFSRSNQKTSIPVRATKTVSTMVVVGRVSSFDETAHILVVDNVRFDDSKDKSLGSWRITPPESFVFSSYPIGTDVKITVNPVTFQIADKTFTAYEIEK
jgi:hypothetical protein